MNAKIGISLNKWIDDIFFMIFEVYRTYNHILEMDILIIARRLYFDVESNMTINFNTSFEKKI